MLSMYQFKCRQLILKPFLFTQNQSNNELQHSTFSMLFDALARIVCCVVSFAVSLSLYLSCLKLRMTVKSEKVVRNNQRSIAWPIFETMSLIRRCVRNQLVEPSNWKKHTYIQHLIVIEGNLSHSLTNSNMGKRDELLVNLWPVNTWNKMFDGMSWFPPKKNSNKIHRTHEKFYFLAAKVAFIFERCAKLKTKTGCFNCATAEINFWMEAFWPIWFLSKRWQPLVKFNMLVVSLSPEKFIDKNSPGSNLISILVQATATTAATNVRAVIRSEEMDTNWNSWCSGNPETCQFVSKTSIYRYQSEYHN